MVVEVVPAVDVSDEAYLTMKIEGQWVGIPVKAILKVLRPQKMMPIPLAPSAISGAMFFNGQVICIVDARKQIGLPSVDIHASHRIIVIEQDEELYGLLIDGVDDVLKLGAKQYDPEIQDADAIWKNVSMGGYRLQDRLLLVLDIKNLLNFE